ncbi:glycosyltransferase family 4 protein [Patescibacteria group bacterium]|nr:glycosyltransferase family 4 protein [Patescibacteria group bacterium]
MKIVIASGIYPPDIGGPATYSKLILQEFKKKEHDVSLICYSDKKDNDVNRILRKNKLSRYFKYFLKLLYLARNCDVIYAQGPLSAGLPAMWVSKILNKRLVIKIVGDYAWEQARNQFNVNDSIDAFQERKYCYGVERIRKIQKKVVNYADSVIVPSNYLKKIVSTWGAKNINVVYNAFVGNDVKEKKLDGDVIISAGRLEPWKGMDLLVDIFPDLLKENANFKLLVIGRGSLSDKIKGKNIELIDRVPHEELMGYFKSGFAFVLNTGYEGLSHILLECLAMGLPVITTNVCGNPEVIENNVNGILVEYNNKEDFKEAILKLYKDKELRNKFIKNGKEKLKNFSLDKMINNTLEKLKNI